MSVCGGLRRLFCWVAEQLAEGRTKKKKLASFRRGPIPVRVPWRSELVGGTEDGAEAVPGPALAARGAML